jgi:hypothetical protein
MSMAHVWLARLRAGAATASAADAANDSAAATVASACLRRIPRALFE